MLDWLCRGRYHALILLMEARFAELKGLIVTMATSQDQFNADLQAYLGEVKGDVQALLQKVDDLKAQVAAGGDFTAADQAVQAAKADLEATLGNAPAPAPGGGTTPPTP